MFSQANRTTLKDLLTLAWPVVLARVGIMTMGLTDAIVVGHYSSKELAYHSLAWAPSSIILTTAVGLMMGVQVMTARMRGEGRYEQIGGVLRRGMIYSMIIGVIAMILLAVLGPLVLPRLGFEDGLGEGAALPLVVFALSMPAYLISVAAQFFLEGLGKPKPGMWAMWLANIINIGLNIVLVPDMLGLGVDGAAASAWATFGARTVLAVFLVIYILRMAEVKAWNVFKKPVRDPALEREQITVGIGAGASNFIEVGAFAAMTIIAGLISANATAGWAIVINTSAIVFMLPMGLSSATAVLVGKAYGEVDHEGVKRAGWIGMAVVAVLATVVGLVIWPTASLITGAYTNDLAVLAIAAPALALATFFFVADAIQVVAAQANRAAGDVAMPTVMHFISYGVVMIPLGWYLAPNLGVNGLVWSVIVASLVSGVLLGLRFHIISKRAARTSHQAVG